MHEHSTGSRWTQFWNRGGWWKAVIIAVAYLVLYNGIGLLTSTIFANEIDRDNVLSTSISFFIAVVLPILLVGAVIVLFAASMGWLRELFARQPIGGSW